ncbi:hypothetical protein YDYSY3_47020 [Paenibacillus chitinolyticus]|nr:hypothetical protein YDYSY3_47020 [Paenibacillus chitinolyticus]
MMRSLLATLLSSWNTLPLQSAKTTKKRTELPGKEATCVYSVNPKLQSKLPFSRSNRAESSSPA